MTQSKPLTPEQTQSLRDQYFKDQTLTVSQLARMYGFGYFQVYYAVNVMYREKHKKHKKTEHKKIIERKEVS